MKKRYWFALSCIGILAGIISIGNNANEAARAAGFENYSEQQEAEKNGFSDPSLWRLKRAEVAQAKQLAETEAAEAAENAKLVEEARCRGDLQCWGDKFDVEASVQCRRPVELMAKNDFEWTDGMLEPKFSHFRWREKKDGVVTYIGDKIKYQNGFGAWIRHTYECDFDTTNKQVIDVRASPGQIRS